MIEQAERRITFIGNTREDLKPFLDSTHTKPSLLPITDEYGDLIKILFADHTVRKKRDGDEDKPPQLIIEDNHERFLDAARQELKKTSNDQSLRDFFKSLVLIRIGAETHIHKTDEATGIRTVHLIRGEAAFPVHPTPAS